MIDSIRFKYFRHPPYSPDNDPNRYTSFYVRLVTFTLLEIWKQAIFDIFVTETMKIVSNSDGLFYIDICNKKIHRHMACVCTGRDHVEQIL